MNLANEGLEARKKEDEVNSRKRKAEEEAQWEGTSSECFASPQSLTLLLSEYREPRAEGRQLEKFLQHKKEEKDEGRPSRMKANAVLSNVCIVRGFQRCDCYTSPDTLHSHVFFHHGSIDGLLEHGRQKSR